LAVGVVVGKAVGRNVGGGSIEHFPHGMLGSIHSPCPAHIFSSMVAH
jgi:hypothetical protein